MSKGNKSTTELAKSVATRLIANAKAQLEGQSKENYIVATVAELTDGAKPDAKAPSPDWYRLEFLAHAMMRRHGADAKKGADPSKIVVADGLSLLIQLSNIGSGLLTAEWGGKWQQWPFDRSTPQPVSREAPTPCERATIVLDTQAADYYDAVNKGLECRKKHGLSGGHMAPSNLFFDDPQGGGSGNVPPPEPAANPCAAEQAVVEDALERLQAAELAQITICQ